MKIILPSVLGHLSKLCGDNAVFCTPALRNVSPIRKVEVERGLQRPTINPSLSPGNYLRNQSHSAYFWGSLPYSTHLLEPVASLLMSTWYIFVSVRSVWNSASLNLFFRSETVELYA